jgi:YfiH family protein
MGDCATLAGWRFQLQRHEADGLVYYQFETLGVPHGVFTRLGGDSEGPLSSLNVGALVGDDPANVQHNRRAMMSVLSLELEAMRTVWQVHGATVLVANGEGPGVNGTTPPKADGIITDQPGLGLVMRFADCVPIVFHDPAQGVIGIAHAGWRGTVAGAGPATVRALQETFGSRPADLRVGIGPSICATHYPVGEEVAAAFKEAFGDTEGLVWRGEDGKPHADLWAANEHALHEAGVTHIEVGGICTADRTEEFFSHRAEHGRTGRFGAVVTLGP